MEELHQHKQLGSNQELVHQKVKEYYGKVLQESCDLKTSACAGVTAPPAHIRSILAMVPDEVLSRFYGCGSSTPQGIHGLRVLDLGSGSGRDCYVCAALVGAQGSVTGVDMTDEQLGVAREHAEAYCTSTLGYPAANLRFVKGEIEHLDQAGIQDESVDLVISNCVVNLSPDKESVLREVYRVLAPGGEMYFSDMYCDRRQPPEVREHPVFLGEGLAGSLYTQDFLRLGREVGFTAPHKMNVRPIQVFDKHLAGLVGEAQYYSITFRLFKLPGRLETLCEDYGQAARYKGTIPGSTHAYTLDANTTLQRGKWYEVCGNTAAMLGESWLAPHFEVIGDRSRHYGRFDCCSKAAVDGPDAAPAAAEACGGGSCC